MQGLVWLFVSGCVLDLTDREEPPFPPTDSGGGSAEAGDACAQTAECASGLRCDGTFCTAGCIRDDECPGDFACGYPGEGHTDQYGCFERCTYDDECKAGTRCDWGIGSCVAD